MKIATLNVGSMTGKRTEIVRLMQEKEIEIMCVQETKWKGSKSYEIGAGYKLIYHGTDNRRNGIGIILSPKVKEKLMNVKRTSDRVMSIKLEINSEIWNIISCYAPQVGCTNEEKEMFWEDMDSTIQEMALDERVVVGGDLNGHVGSEKRGYEEAHGGYGIGEMNEDGIKVLEFAIAYQLKIMNTMFQKLPNHLVTYNSNGNQTQIDFIMVKKDFAKEIIDCKALPGEQITSQHRVVIMKLKTKRRFKRKTVGKKRIRWWKLKDSEIRQRFIQVLRAKMEDVQFDEQHFEDQYNTLSRLIRECGIEVCGISSGKRKPGKDTWWWNNETEKVVKEKRNALKRWKQTGSVIDREEYRRCSKIARKVIGRETYNAVEKLYEELETKEGENNIYRLAAARDRKTKDIGNMYTVKNEDSAVLYKEDEIKARWKRYFEALFNEENLRNDMGGIEIDTTEGPLPCVTERDVRAALKKMKNNKATGPDQIPGEVWKVLGDEGVRILKDVFNMVIKTGRMPEEWRKSILVPIYKGKGDVLSCSNYRGIKLLCHTFKLWERIVNNWLREIVSPDEMHFGFMPQKGTTDAIFALRQVIEKQREGQGNMSAVFIDLEKAYDRVPREELWKALRTRKVPEHLVVLIKDMYDGCSTIVRCEAGESEPFGTRVGVHQGSTLSPFLFVLLMDVLTEEVKLGVPSSIIYADDIMICLPQTTDLNVALEQWREKLEDRGLVLNRNKTKWMKCKFNQEEEEDVDLEMDGTILEEVDTFKYLGSVIQKDGGIENEITSRIQAGWGNWKKCSGVLCDKKMPMKLKSKVHRTIVRPAMIYGSETWSTTKKEEKRLDVNEMRMLRWTCGVTKLDRIANRYIRGTMKVSEVSGKIKERRLAWYGHVERREENHYLRRIVNMEIPGRRRRGRPKTRWKDCVRRDMEEVGLQERDAMDRNRWKKVLKNHFSDPV